MIEKEILKWESEYINDIDIEELEWIKLKNLELREFYRENYLDSNSWKYVAIRYNYYASPLGLHYLTLDAHSSILDYSYLLGIVNNNIGKKTIVAAMVYLENYDFFGEDIKPITYISTVEVNHYFRNMGIFKKMCEESIKYIDKNHHIIVSPESDMGQTCNTFEIFKKTMLKNGFIKGIWNERLIERYIYDFYNYLKGDRDSKVLKK